MVNGAGRLRVKEFICGIANCIRTRKCKRLLIRTLYPPISKNSVAGHDCDDRESGSLLQRGQPSAVRFLETGQEIRAYFGYDVNNDGKIEWLDPFNGYLKKWSADDQRQSSRRQTDLTI